MDHALDILTGLLPRPAEARPKNWDPVHQRLGTGLPADYRAFIDAYGGGRLDHYLWILEPGCANEFYDLLAAAEERAEANTDLWSGGEPRPAELDRPDARIIPWASTDNGEFLYWLAEPGRHPDRWTVLVNEARGPRWEHFDLTFARFLAHALTGRTRSLILSDRFPATPHDFRPSARFA